MGVFKFLAVAVLYVMIGSLMRYYAVQQIVEYHAASSIFESALLTSNSTKSIEIARSVKMREVKYSAFCFILDYAFIPFRMSFNEMHYIRFGVKYYASTIPACNKSIINENIGTIMEPANAIANFNVTNLHTDDQITLSLARDKIEHYKGKTIKFDIVYIEGCDTSARNMFTGNIVDHVTVPITIGQ